MQRILPLFLFFCPALAFAQAQSVGVQVLGSCELRTPVSSLDFGQIGPGPIPNTDRTLTLEVRCTSGTPYRLTAWDTGLWTNRLRMVNSIGTHFLTYNIARDATAANNNQFISPGGAWSINATGNGAWQSHSVLFRIFAATPPAVGTYTDTRSFTVEY